MTYEQLVEKVKETYENADAKKVTEHVAIEFNVSGEAEGAFYLEIADSKIKVEPFEYYDRDVKIFTSAEVIADIADGKTTVETANNNGSLRTEGNTGKAFLLDQVVVKAKKAAAKKTVAKKEEPKKTVKAAEKKTAVKKEEPKKAAVKEEAKAVKAEAKAEAKAAKAEAKAEAKTAKTVAKKTK